MNTTVRNIFGVAAAILVLLGVNIATDNINGAFNGTEKEGNVDSVVNTEKPTPAENRSVASLKDFNDAIVDIAEKTNPAVVTITTKRTQEIRRVNPFSQFFGMPQGEGQTQERIQRGLGSGVIVSEDGYILTNNHVIDNTDEITVRMYSGEEVEAELIGTDPQTDIAVLKVEENNLPAVTLGNSDNLKVGSFVLAIGSPLSENLAHTVSFGIVSARGRSLTNLTAYGDYIQTDAAINPGNSGGALIDVNGQLVGINSAIASRSGGNDGIGFAIPANLAKRIMDDLVDDGEVSRGYLGMTMGGEVDQTMAKALDLDDTRGIMVGRVEEGSPAENAGLQAEDVIVSLNGEEIRNWDNFRTSIASFKPGDEITLGIVRDNDNMELEVTLGERPDDATASASSQDKDDLNERLGFTVTDLTAEIRRQLDLENETEGVIVRNVRQGSDAFERGLRRGDVITSVNKNKIDSSDEFYSQLERSLSEEDNVVLLTVLRNDVKQYLAFEL
ncbi:DegQ family serine endoprotease [Gracilimonas mengyeensis]|uniref:Serine protease Do n=1 Tax=Gracilimonas mengyeensis TaxID=1302730 RepID=A0A521B5E9_9BACT|nr:DegQ family serine endoprotease [Gracilimonas mengyeensis]SMO42283.1 serine protease Do [Gracilimonas mengyeensis]